MLPWLGNSNSLVNCCLRGVGTSLCGLWPEVVNPWRQKLCFNAVTKFQSLAFYLINKHLLVAYSTWKRNAWCVANHHANFNEPRQAIFLTNVRTLSIGPLGTNFNEIFIKIQTFSFPKMHLQISSAKWRPFCTGGDELKRYAVIVQVLPA